MLLEEFARAGFNLNMNIRKTLDVQKIFYKMEPRTLSAAYKLYCGKQIENAHDALADVRATVEVLKGMISRYEGVDYVDGDGFTHVSPISSNLSKVSDFTGDSSIIDVTHKLKYNAKKEIVFNFGKYQGQAVLDVLLKDKQYYNWILNKDFSVQVKQTIKKILDDHYKQQKEINT